MDHKILEIKNVTLALLKSKPPQLAITAIGSVPTTGYSNPHLIPYHYFVPPADGIYDFDFVATSPSGHAGNLILPVVGTFVMEMVPAALKGVRVHASTNMKEALLESKGELKEIEFA
jgi:hypothetical protein